MEENVMIDSGVIMNTRYLTTESAYFLGGIFSANELISAKKNGEQYYVAPYRFNPTHITREKQEEHADNVRVISDIVGGVLLNKEQIIETFNAPKFSRLPGFGVVFKKNPRKNLIETIPEITLAMKSSSLEVQKSFIVGMFDGRGSLDVNMQNGMLRYIVLDCDDINIGEFLAQNLKDFGFSINYNFARDRLEGGKARNNQLRISGRDKILFAENIGFVSDIKILKLLRTYDNNEEHRKYKIEDQSDILKGLKIIKELF